MKRVSVVQAFKLSSEFHKDYFIAIKFACCQTVISTHLLYKALSENKAGLFLKISSILTPDQYT